MKCETCINSRPIISENGIHYICCLSPRKSRNCIFYYYKHYVENPMLKFAKKKEVEEQSILMKSIDG